jgi:hypothetical protein
MSHATSTDNPGPPQDSQNSQFYGPPPIPNSRDNPEDDISMEGRDTNISQPNPTQNTRINPDPSLPTQPTPEPDRNGSLDPDLGAPYRKTRLAGNDCPKTPHQPHAFPPHLISQNPTITSHTKKRRLNVMHPDEQPFENLPEEQSQDEPIALLLERINDPYLPTEDTTTWLKGINAISAALSNAIYWGTQTRPMLDRGHKHILEETLDHVSFAKNEVAKSLGITDPPPSTDNAVLNAINQLSNRMRAQEDAISQIQRKISTPNSLPTANPPSAQRPPIPTLTHPNSYAKKAAKASQIPNPQTKKPTTPQKKSPLRYVIRFHGDPPPIEDRIQSERAMKRINDRLSDKATAQEKLSVIGVDCKPNGNYIITFSPSSPVGLADEHKQQLLHALAPGHPSASVVKDVPWTKIIVHNISRRDHLFQPRDSESLSQAILVNPVLENVEITQQPRFISSEEKLDAEHKTASAVSFSFIDKPNSILQKILTEPFYMFGRQVRVERWNEIPKPTQCKRCWKVGHKTIDCPRKTPRCRKCGYPEAESLHATHCNTCKTSDDTSNVCNHSNCANCQATDHLADDPKCPWLAKHLFKSVLPKPRNSPSHNHDTPMAT